MITRYALFDGTIKQGQTEAFRAAVLAEILPKWRAFPAALPVRATCAESRDDGAPEYPMIPALNHPDLKAVEAALASPVRTEARAATEAVLARFFTGTIHHHVTSAHEFEPL